MRRSARSRSNTTVIAIASVRSCAHSSTRPRRIDADTYDDARRTTRRARRALIDLLADGEVMLTPSAPGAAPKGLGSTGEPTFNRLWTLLGTPCVNVPGLSDADGLPLGVQIVARFGRDRFALSVAALLERAIARSECG